MMEKLPVELYDIIVTKLHDNFCGCDSWAARPSAWETPRQAIDVYDARRRKPLQGELCRLRLVNKKFHEPATRYLLSHGTLAFDVSYLDSVTIKKQVQYCMTDNNQDILSRVSGLRIDLLLAAVSRHLRRLDPKQPDASRVTAARIMAAEAAKDEFETSLSSIGSRFKSVTSLELRLDGSSYTRTWDPRSRVEAFVGRHLPKLEDLCIHGDTPDIMYFLQRMPIEQCSQLRRLLLYSENGQVQMREALRHFEKVTELGIKGFLGGQFRLPPHHQGLTRLRLSSTHTSAATLINLVTKGPSAAGPSSSPLVEVVIRDMVLGRAPGFFFHAEQYEVGTWHSVFKAIKDSCPKLTFLHVDHFAYRRPTPWPSPEMLAEEVERDREDNVHLESLVAQIRARRGGYAFAAVYLTDQGLRREL